MKVEFAKLAVLGVQGLVPYQPGKSAESVAQSLGLDSVVKLASNECPLGPSPTAVAAATAAVAEAGRYPDSDGAGLRQQLAARHGLGAEWITLGNGSNDVLELMARVFVTQQDEVIYSRYAFAVYPVVTQSIGAGAVVTEDRDYGHDLQAMAAAITPSTRMIFIANPNNPTGTWVTEAALEEFLEHVPSEVLVVVDEAYYEYVQESEYPDASQWLSRYRNLIVTRSFSKAHGLAGLRLGYALADPEITGLLNRARQPFNVNRAALAAAGAALEDRDHLARSLAVNREGMSQLQNGFHSLGLSYIPSVGNFLCVKVGRGAAKINDALLQRGVIVRPVDNYGLSRYLRVSVGLPEENQRLLHILGEVLSTQGGPRPASGAT